MAESGTGGLAGLRRLTLVNTAVLGVNVLLTLVMLVGQLGGDGEGRRGAAVGSLPSAGGGVATTGAPPTPGATGTAAAPPAPDDGPERTAKFIEDTITPVKKAIADMGKDASRLPTDDEVAAAKASGSLASAESGVVIDKLKSAYAQVNMPFPQVPVGGVGQPTAGATPPAAGTAPKPPDAPAATSTDGSDQAILRAYFQVAISRVEREAKKKELDVSSKLPDGAAVQAAVASGDIGSDASRSVLATLRTVYAEVGVTFMEPAVP